MTRTLTSGMAAAVAAETGVRCYFFEFAFLSGTVRWTSAPHDVVWNSLTWTAIGGALSPDTMPESADLSAGGATLTLPGVDQGIIALILGDQYIGRPAKIWKAAMNPATGAVIADPWLEYSGFMNGGWTITEDRNADGSAGTVTVTTQLTSRLAGLDQRRGIQPNIGSHQSLYPGDRFFEFVGQIVGASVVWK